MQTKPDESVTELFSPDSLEGAATDSAAPVLVCDANNESCATGLLRTPRQEIQQTKGFGHVLVGPRERTAAAGMALL